MQKKQNFFPIFFLYFSIAIIVFILAISGKVSSISGFFGSATSKIQGTSFGFFKSLLFFREDSKIKRLEDDNLDLNAKLLNLKKLQKENSALSDQFKTSNPISYDLLKANVVGAPGFVPQVTYPSYFILDKGSQDGVKKGQAVVVKDNLVGRIVDVSSGLSKVDLIGSSSFSFAAKTDKEALGVIKGSGIGKMTLDNILLSETVDVSDLVLTKGDINISGLGLPPDLIVGKIQSIDKTPSSLFQKAEIKSLLNISKLSIVFIVMP